MADELVQAQVPADVEAADRILWGLTARQVAILAGAAAPLWLAYRALADLVPPVLLLAAAVPVAATVAGLALARRDGIGMDRWVAAALAMARTPRRLAVAGDRPAAVPWWAPQAATGSGAATTRPGRTAGTPAVAPLRLPATAIGDGGVMDLAAHGRVALTAVSTVTFDLRTPDEQSTLIEAAGRWLNALSTPVQIVVSTRPVDVDAHAEQVEAQLADLPHPALAEAAASYAAFLRWLGEQRDPLHRQVLVAHRVGAHTDPPLVRRCAEQTARALAGLGAATRVLDGGLVTDVLATACDPWRPAGTGRATPTAVISGLDDGSVP